MTSSQIVVFVVDKERDIANHFIALRSYKRNKERGFQQQKNENLERLSELDSDEKVQIEIEKIMEPYYKKEDKLISLAQDINEEWIKIEKDFIQRLERVHKNSFSSIQVKGVLSSASRFGYKQDEEWFATNMFNNKFLCMDTAMHELMHFMFHRYYDKVCEEKGLSSEQMWDVKESFTALLNLEFGDLRFQADKGYPPHTKLREVIKTSWEKESDFDKTLEAAIMFVKSNNVV